MDKVCDEISEGDDIDPFGRAHVKRNACNRCPSTNPIPAQRIIPRHGRNPERTVITHYDDGEGNMWDADSGLSAPVFHGDAGLGNRTAGNQTYRISFAPSGGRGWQCRYFGGVLDDTSLDLGTYDYADGGTWTHKRMDVNPHNANPNYAPNLTETY